MAKVISWVINGKYAYIGGEVNGEHKDPFTADTKASDTYVKSLAGYWRDKNLSLYTTEFEIMKDFVTAQLGYTNLKSASNYFNVFSQDGVILLSGVDGKNTYDTGTPYYNLHILNSILAVGLGGDYILDEDVTATTEVFIERNGIIKNGDITGITITKDGTRVPFTRENKDRTILLTIPIPKDTSFLNDTKSIKYVITVFCENGFTTSTYFTVNGVKNGKEGTFYNLNVFPKIIKKNANGQYSATGVTATCFENGSPSVSGAFIKFTFNGTDEFNYTGAIQASNIDSEGGTVTFRLYFNGIVIDSDECAIVSDGVDASIASRAELTNEIDGVSLGSDNVLDTEAIVGSGAKLFTGATEAFITALSISGISTADNVLCRATYGNESFVSGFTQLVEGNVVEFDFGGIAVKQTDVKFELLFSQGFTFNSNYRENLSVYLTGYFGDNNSITADTDYTVIGLKGGKDGEIYRLQTSIDYTSYDSASGYSEPSVSCTAVTFYKGELIPVSGASYSMYYSTDFVLDEIGPGMNEYTGETIDFSAETGNISSVTFYLYYNASGDDYLIDRETVPVIFQGVDGKDGDAYTIRTNADTSVFNPNNETFSPNIITCEAYCGTEKIENDDRYELRFSVDELKSGRTETSVVPSTGINLDEGKQYIGLFNRIYVYLFYTEDNITWEIFAVKEISIVRAGSNGADGKDGKDGKDGAPGAPGRKGAAVRGPIDWDDTVGTVRRFCNGVGPEQGDEEFIDIISKYDELPYTLYIQQHVVEILCDTSGTVYDTYVARQDNPTQQPVYSNHINIPLSLYHGTNVTSNVSYIITSSTEYEGVIRVENSDLVVWLSPHPAAGVFDKLSFDDEELVLTIKAMVGGIECAEETVTLLKIDRSIAGPSEPRFSLWASINEPIILNESESFVPPTIDLYYSAATDTQRIDNVTEVYWGYDTEEPENEFLDTITLTNKNAQYFYAKVLGDNIIFEKRSSIKIPIIRKTGVEAKKYRCKESYTQASSDTWNSVSQYWEEAEHEYDFVAANLLLAKNAKIKFLTGNEIYLGNDDNEITAGISGNNNNGDGIAFWAGDENPNNANYRVSHSGAFSATTAYIEGEVHATSGSFTGEVNASSGSFTGEVNASSGSFKGNVSASTLTLSGSSRLNLCNSAGVVDSGLIGNTGNNNGIAFWAGNSDPLQGKFKVDHDGNLSAETGVFGGYIQLKYVDLDSLPNNGNAYCITGSSVQNILYNNPEGKYDDTLIIKSPTVSTNGMVYDIIVPPFFVRGDMGSHILTVKCLLEQYGDFMLFVDGPSAVAEDTYYELCSSINLYPGRYQLVCSRARALPTWLIHIYSGKVKLNSSGTSVMFKNYPTPVTSE